MEGTEKDSSQKTSPLGDAEKSDTSVDSILEKFIMIIRALEDEWMTFSGSEEYQELPEDMLEEAEEKEREREKPQPRVKAPSRQMQRMLHAYRAPSIYQEEFALEDILYRKQ